MAATMPVRARPGARRAAASLVGVVATAVLLLATLTTASRAYSQAPFAASYADAAPASQADVDPASSATSGFGGPLRIELPFEPHLYRHHAPTAADSTSGGRLTAQDLIAQQDGKHVILTHREFPDVSLRVKRIHRGRRSQRDVKKPKDGDMDPDTFCDPTVTSWSGYVDTIDGKSLFFYLFESRDKPDTDPLISFMNGGPGCASELALLQELGPCRIKDSNGTYVHPGGPPINGTTWNPHSWNDRANLMFIDQPVGVGFSYSRYGIPVYDSDNAAKDFYRFLRIFFSAFEGLQSVPYIMASESYGGRYVPRFAAEVVDGNRAVQLRHSRAGTQPQRHELIPLKKAAIGNGLSDIAVQVPQYYDFACTARGGVKPVLGVAQCKRMATWKRRCETWLEERCRKTFDPDLCAAAADTCQSELAGPYMELGINPYNILDECKAGISPNLCYNVVQDIRDYLNRDDVRELLGAAPVSEIGKYQSCNMDVAGGFSETHDANVANNEYIELLLEHGIEIMAFVGRLDWICNWLGNLEWVKRLSWTRADEFRSDEMREWFVDGRRAGDTQSGGGFTWATVDMAGHMVPYDRPRQALQLIQRWVDGEKL